MLSKSELPTPSECWERFILPKRKIFGKKIPDKEEADPLSLRNWLLPNW